MDPNESVKGNIEIESAYRATQSIHEDEFNTVRDANPLLNASREGSEPASRIFTAVYSIDGNQSRSRLKSKNGMMNPIRVEAPSDKENDVFSVYTLNNTETTAANSSAVMYQADGKTNKSRSIVSRVNSNEVDTKQNFK